MERTFMERNGTERNDGPRYMEGHVFAPNDRVISAGRKNTRIYLITDGRCEESCMTMVCNVYLTHDYFGSYTLPSMCRRPALLGGGAKRQRRRRQVVSPSTIVTRQHTDMFSIPHSLVEVGGVECRLFSSPSSRSA